PSQYIISRLMHLDLYVANTNLTFVFFFIYFPLADIYTLSLHDALPILRSIPPSTSSPTSRRSRRISTSCRRASTGTRRSSTARSDRKSTRLNSSHVKISYAVFCLKKKKDQNIIAMIHKLTLAIYYKHEI